MTSTPVCLFHDRQYSSNTQRILNLLRINLITIKCDLNSLAKTSLCTCNLPDPQPVITDKELTKTQKEFNKMKSNLKKQWPGEIDQVLQKHIMNTCHNNISIYKLLNLICDISNRTIFSQIEKKDKKTIKSSKRSKSSSCHRRRIELMSPPNKLGHLLGRHGHQHKSIMTQTDTRIHFDNAPFSVSSSKRCPEFDLELFQSSSSTLRVTITGKTLKGIENATKLLKELDEECSG